MNWEEAALWAERISKTLSKRARSGTIALLAVLALLGVDVCRRNLRRHVLTLQPALSDLNARLVDAADVLDDETALRELKEQDVQRVKAALLKLTRSRQALYESGLDLQEERRLLEKLWEILTTYMMVDEGAHKISLMRGNQALESYPIAYDPPKAFGAETRPFPASAVIISKERYAAPERGKFELVNGQLVWIPPQVGASVRANALGEFVIFTDGPLILHGPPKKQKDHELFAHDCLGLSLYAARNLYSRSFIGTKIILKKNQARTGTNSSQP